MSEKSPAQKAAEALEKERERQRIAQINAQINSNNESIVNYNNWKDSCVSIKSEMTNAVNAWKTAKEEFGKCSIASTVEKKNVFEDRSDEIMETSITARLLSFPNVIITSHQGFFTYEALDAISETTLNNAMAFTKGERTGNEVEIE